MAKIGKISGFPEWLPEQKLVEQSLVEKIRKLYEAYGFTPIETPAVELISTLASKGVIDKEIFVVKRLKSEGDEEAELGLHFDLTVPFARYVAQHSNELVFPFKRYQLQKVWRGDRPQKGRFREFYQFDIDVVARDLLPVSCDAEVLSALCEAMTLLNLGPFRVRVNSRKILSGLYAGLGLEVAQVKAAITAVDKLNKIGVDGVRNELTKIEGVNDQVATVILKSTTIQCSFAEFESQLTALNVTSDVVSEGISELIRIGTLLSKDAATKVVFDGSLARGLDYYSGIIFEAEMINNPEFGTVAAGGRYDNLASDFTEQKLPGVGASIGLTRLLELGFTNGLLEATKKSPSVALVSVYDEEQRVVCNELARELREAGVTAEVYFKSPKLGKQIEYAEAKGMQYVFFIDQGGGVKVKDLVSKEQVDVVGVREWAEQAVS